ncbi:MAG TPA: 30S ribosomal protein S17e [Candidatus Nanoarchaeia archaeon]|nr:30S ribosomal protein S17e [Candidatus Nanoarchaeia archaeon]
MGRIKTKQVKRITNEIIQRFGDEAATTFDENKKFVSRRLDTQSKKLRNIIAGYTSRLKRKMTAAQ